MWNANLDDFLWDGSIKELNFLEWGKGWDFFLDGKGGGGCLKISGFPSLPDD